LYYIKLHFLTIANTAIAVFAALQNI